jgi:hypothetical protein
LVLNPKHVCSATLTLSVSCWGPRQWAPLTNALFTSPASAALNYPRPVIMNGDRGSSQIPGALCQHPMGSFVTTNIFFTETTAYHDRGQGQHLLGGQPSMSSSTSVVAATGATASTSQGARHRRLLQLRWWLLLELPAAPPRRPSHRRLLQLRWWLLPELPAAPPRGPPSTSSSTLVVIAARATSITSQGDKPTTSSSTSVVAAVGAIGSTS